MPPPPIVEAFTDARLDAFYDHGTLLRGRSYANEDRVRLLVSGPGAINAACRGSQGAAYVVAIRWSARGDRIELDDTCSCPIGGGCKHCVAVILTARRSGALGTPVANVGRATPEWRQAFRDLATVDDGQDTRPTRLALLLTVQDAPPGRFGSGVGPQVTVRPMRRSKAGKWVKTGASWRDIDSPYGHQLGDVDVLHRTAIRSLMACGRIGAYSHIQAVPLDHFGSDLWYQLERATEVGVELIGTRAEDVVELAPSAAKASIDLTADSDGAVTLAGSFTLDDHPLALGIDRAGLVGNPAHGLWTATGNRLRLVRLAAPLHPAVARLANHGTVTVPAGDVDELLDVYQPVLARHAAVASSDNSVTVTANEFDTIVLVVGRTALDTATLRWTARYLRGERATRHSIHHVGQGRDHTAESAAIDRLGLAPHLFPGLVDADGSPRDLTVSGLGVLALLNDVLPELRTTYGIEVEVIGDQPSLREATEDPRIALSVSDGGGHRDGNDWFDLDVAVSVDGEAVDFVRLFAALNQGDEALILPSGTWLRLDRPEFAKLRELIAEARALAEPTGPAVARLSRFQAGWWDELTRLGTVTEQSQRWAENVSQLAALAAPEPVDLPSGLEATLRPYQQEGLDWLAFLHQHRLGGILADDMGLGKTVQALALMLHVVQHKPDARFLVVAPTSVVENWAREAARFAPGLSVRTIRETERRRGTPLAAAIEGATVVVTSYALFRIEFDDYALHDWEVLLLDEAQFVKNHQGKTYQCVRRLDVATKVAITGTPLENTLMDLWSLLSITAPGLYPDPKRFSDAYRKPIENGTAPERLATLRRRIAPLLRRRTKDAVLTELPPKVEQTVEIELSARHARIYETQLQRQRQKVLGLVGDVQKHRFEILKSLTILRQLALDPGLVDEQHDAVGSAKLDRLVEDLEQVVAEGHRALVFSQFTRYLARVRARLDAAGTSYAYLDGRTRKRQEEIDRFKDGDAPVFVISLKAGGFGLNLTEADYCFVLDPWWNPATETQAVDRAHRMGQQNPVMVYRYVSTGTIEEKVMELKARKAALFDSIMDDEGALAGALTEEDIRGLLDLG